MHKKQAKDSLPFEQIFVGVCFHVRGHNKKRDFKKSRICTVENLIVINISYADRLSNAHEKRIKKTIYLCINYFCSLRFV